MYTLRKLFPDNVEANMALGRSYTVHSLDTAPEAFNRMFKEVFNKDYEDSEKECYSFVSSEGGKDFYPLYKKQYNFIVNENGGTFSNLSHSSMRK